MLLLLFACSENYPDAHSEASILCRSETSDYCDDVLARDLGDPDGLLFEVARALVTAPVDPWFYDLVADRIDEVVWDEAGARFTEADAEYVEHSRKLVLYRPEMFEGLAGASALVHEAGHGRPGDHGHIPCADGELQCDDTLFGAVGTQLLFLEEAIDAVGASELLELRDQTEERLLLEG